MDRREFPRVNCRQVGFLTILDAPDRTPYPATLLDQSGRGACIALDHQLRPGQLVRLDTKEGLLLGEVVHVTQNGGQQIAGLKLDHALASLSDLRNLLTQLELDQLSKPAAAKPEARGSNLIS